MIILIAPRHVLLPHWQPEIRWFYSPVQNNWRWEIRPRVCQRVGSGGCDKAAKRFAKCCGSCVESRNRVKGFKTRERGWAGMILNVSWQTASSDKLPLCRFVAQVVHNYKAPAEVAPLTAYKRSFFSLRLAFFFFLASPGSCARLLVSTSLDLSLSPAPTISRVFLSCIISRRDHRTELWRVTGIPRQKRKRLDAYNVIRTRRVTRYRLTRTLVCTFPNNFFVIYIVCCQ